MLRALHAGVARHRWWVLGIWVAMVAAAVPFALQQSDRLTGGGFAVPGSESERVEAAVQRGVAGQLPAAGAGARSARRRGRCRCATTAPRLNALDRAAGRVRHVSLDPTLKEAALYQPPRTTPASRWWSR